MDIISVLMSRNGVRRGNEIKFSCPFPESHKHGDKNPSCQYNVEKESFFCFACGAKGGRASLELLLGVSRSIVDLPFIANQDPPPLPPGIRKTWKSKALGELTLKRFWMYRDADETPLGFVARYDNAKGDKKEVIPYFRGNGDGRWHDGDPPRPAKLYNLNLVSKATDQPVWIVEGEKCAEAIVSLGGIATTSQGGCLSAGKSDWSPLAGRRVFIWPDADKPGEKYCVQVCELLKRLTPKPQIEIVDTSKIGMGEAEDVVDYLCRAPGADLEELLDLPMRDKPGIKPDSIKKICQTTFDPPRWAIEGLVPEGLAVLAGKPKCGKSWLTLDWANQVTMQDESAESLVLALEDSPRRIQYRCAKLGIDRNQRAHILTDTNPMSDVLDPLDGLNQIEPWLEEHPNCRLVVIDTIGRFLPRKKSSRNSDMYADALADFCRLQRFATDHRIALLCITHMKKGEFSPDFIDDALGSVGITATCDCVMSLRRVTRGEAEGVLLITGRDIDDKSIAMEFSDGKWESKGDAKDYTSNKAVAAVYKIIRDTGSMKYSELKNALDLEPGTLKNTLHNMVNGIQGVKYLSYFAVTGTYSTIDLPG